MTDLAAARAALLATPRPLDELSAVAAPGVYAWWGSIPFPADFPDVDPSLPAYVGIAAGETLGERTATFHLSRTRGSSLRRSMTGLLVDELDLWPELTASRRHFGLTAAGEARLTAWMRSRLQVTWMEHQQPEPIELAMIAELIPPLNDRNAPRSSPYRAPMRTLRRAVREASRAS